MKAITTGVRLFFGARVLRLRAFAREYFPSYGYGVGGMGIGWNSDY